MADLINLTIDGRAVQVPTQTLVIDAAKTVGIEIPAFCYYEGLTLQAACRMCLVEVEKMPKQMTACTLHVSEGMGVGALGVINRGVFSEIAPNTGDHLECDECGACIDICPVGALTSGAYRYKTRPWEMTHTGTICTHCADGCKTTLGTRNDEIVRGNNRDHSGVNGEFLCVKGRYAFDFYNHPERLQAPMVRVNGKLEETSWAKALGAVAAKFKETL